MNATHHQPETLAEHSEASAADLSGLWRDFEQELRRFVRPKVDSQEACDDLVQTAFVRAQQAVESGTEPQEPRAWLYQIVRNLLVDVYRSQKRQREALSTLKNEGNPLLTRSDTNSSEGEVAQIISLSLPAFVKTLQDPYRQALELTDLRGLSQAEAAREAGVSLSCMKARVKRARSQLLASLKRCCTFELDRRGRPIACSPRSGGISCQCD
jgi:RNA polymerase sigma-70 factor (ECF subfamily)